MRKVLCGIAMLLLGGALALASGLIQESATDSVPSPGQPSSPEDQEAWREIAGIQDLNQKAELAARYLEGFPAGGYVAYAHAILAAYYEERNRVAEFLDHAEAALRDLPDEAVLLVSLSVAYAEKQQPDPAIVRGERALEILPEMDPPVQFEPEAWEKERRIFSGEAHYAIGTAYLFKAFEGGEDSEFLEQALEHLQLAVDLNPGDPRAHFRLGFGYEMKEEYEKAVVAYARSVAAGDLDSKPAEERLRQTYEKVHGNTVGIEELVYEQREELEKLKDSDS
jgi:tetratricopeptide (TPR) repeat protein